MNTRGIDESSMLIISVVIATYNRCTILETTLRKLALQSVSPNRYEVFVVDDGSTDRTSEVVKALIDILPFRLRYMCHKNRGPGYTQNRGIREADCKLILLMPDDIWVSHQFIEQHIKTHAEHSGENIAVLGKVLQSPELPQTTMHRHWDPFLFYLLEDKMELDSLYFLACNISLKKEFLLRNGMYKERYGAAHEDIELGYRLGQKGLKIIYNSNALAYHYHLETLMNACQRAYERGYNFDLLKDSIPIVVLLPHYKFLTFEAGLKVFVKMLPREIIRLFLFNRLFVDFFWLPVLKCAERCSVFALFAHRFTYRGGIGCYLRKGYNKIYQERQVNASS